MVVWPTHREDWVAVYQELSFQFDLVFLSGLSEDSFNANYVSNFAKSIYWSDFTSARQLLEKIEPDKIVFMSVDTGLSMTLNLIAKKLEIETFVLQHGIYTNYKDYRIRERLWKKTELSRESSAVKSSIGFSSARFVSNSLTTISKIWLPLIFIYSFLSKKVGPYWVSKNLPLPIKRVDKYLCFSPSNATIHLETDRVSSKRITYIGSFELMKYIERSEKRFFEKYYLHIDQALAENSFGEETVSREQMINFYLKLNDFCLTQSAKLYIKLHPESHNCSWLPQDDNIVYLRKVDDFNVYVQSAIGCFGFYSTMIIPAVYWRPTILFNLGYSGLQEALVRDIKIECLDFGNFESSDLIFKKEPSDHIRQIIMEKYIRPSASVSLTEALK